MVAMTEVLADTLNLSIHINDQPVEITALEYKAKADNARQITFQVYGAECTHHLFIGAKVKVTAGREREVSNLGFKGLVKQITPNPKGATVMAVDYVTSLATSDLVDYLEADILGRDLYFLAVNAMNISEIDVSDLKLGSPVRATPSMGLTGVQTRKSFIQKCFDNMYYLAEGANYNSVLNLVYYNYAIHAENKMSIFKIDTENILAEPVLKISLTNNSIEDLVAILDTTKLVNSYTVTSSENDKMKYTYKNNDSIRKHGVVSKTDKVNTDNFPVIANTTQKYVEQNKNPSLNFSFTIRNAEHLSIGDLVEVNHPLLEQSALLPISEYNISFKNGIKTTVTLGRKRLTLGESISKIL